MKICIIPPISHLELANYGSGMHMALTHLVTPDRPKYSEFYRERSEKGDFILLDNSAFELEKTGKGLDPEPVLNAAKQIQANEVIATDVLLDGDATVESTRNFIKEHDKFYLHANEDERIPQIMAVVQGKTMEEWLDCYVRLVHMPGVNTIGFSKISIPVAFGTSDARTISGGVARARIALYNTLTSRKMWPGQMRFGHDYKDRMAIHLLGGDNWTPYELAKVVMLNTMPNIPYEPIRSNDTSAAVWYGASAISFNPDDGRADTLKADKPDLENNYSTTYTNIEANMTTILQNIAVFHKFASK